MFILSRAGDVNCHGKARSCFAGNPILMSGGPDSNRRPSPWQGDILPLNYHRRVLRIGVEPISDLLQRPAVTTLATSARVDVVGFEPTAFSM